MKSCSCECMCVRACVHVCKRARFSFVYSGGERQLQSNQRIVANGSVY